MEPLADVMRAPREFNPKDTRSRL